MSMLKSVVLVAVAAVGLGVSAGESQAAVRQYYSKHWERSGGYYHRTYYYQPTVNVQTYQYHRVIYYPTRPKHLYYYNPYSKKYWGRFDMEKNGYSKLAPEDQNEKLTEIKDEKFPAPTDMPNIPDSTDTVRIDVPPTTDLPYDESKDLTKEQYVEQHPTVKPNALPQQSYSGWVKNDTGYTGNYYVQKPDYSYSCHKVYYEPQKNYIYYQNAHSGKYWGRYDVKAKGYSLLADADKKADLKDIPESAFPKPGDMPQAPGTQIKMDVPRSVDGLTDTK